MKLFFALLFCGCSALAFELSTFQEEIPESNPVTRTVITDSKMRFSFIAPRNWTVAADRAAKRVTLADNAGQSSIAVRSLTNSMPSGISFKNGVKARFNGAEVLEEFPAASGVGAGVGIDVKYALGGSLLVVSRVVVFPAPAGSIEVTFTAPAAEFEKLHVPWTGFINSLRLDRLGAPVRPG